MACNCICNFFSSLFFFSVSERIVIQAIILLTSAYREDRLTNDKAPVNSIRSVIWETNIKAATSKVFLTLRDESCTEEKKVRKDFLNNRFITILEIFIGTNVNDTGSAGNVTLECQILLKCF